MKGQLLLLVLVLIGCLFGCTKITPTRVVVMVLYDGTVKEFRTAYGEGITQTNIQHGVVDDSNHIAGFTSPNHSLDIIGNDDDYFVFHISDFHIPFNGNIVIPGNYTINDSFSFEVTNGYTNYSYLNAAYWRMLEHGAAIDRAVSGTLIITKVDAASSTISGSFKAHTENRHEISCTFDSLYVQLYESGNASNAFSATINGQSFTADAFSYQASISHNFSTNRRFTAASFDGSLVEIAFAENTSRTFLRAITYVDSASSTDIVNVGVGQALKNYAEVVYLKNGSRHTATNCSVTVTSIDSASATISGSFHSSGNGVDIINGTFSNISLGRARRN